MKDAPDLGEKRAGAEDIFGFLQGEILSLRLRPGDKLSEADVAARFGVSRQPVRDAFSRLANLDLLVIRPKRATEVKRFSTREIEKSRFVRSAVEERVLRRAAERCDLVGGARLDMALAEQEQVLKKEDVEAFATLDYSFHKTLCEIAGVDFAFDVILAEKSKGIDFASLVFRRKRGCPTSWKITRRLQRRSRRMRLNVRLRLG